MKNMTLTDMDNDLDKLHVASEYTIKYDTVAGFDGLAYELRRLLVELGAVMFISNDDYDPYDDFAVTLASWMHCIEKLKNPSLLTDDVNEYIGEILENMNMNRNEVASKMAELLDIADTKDGYLHFSYYK